MLVRTFALLVLVTSAFAQRGQYAVPNDAEIEKYPILAGPLTPAQTAEMRLRPIKILSPVMVENHFRNLHGKEGRFVLETLPVGTLVYIDSGGRIRYKADCGNRLVDQITKPVVTSVFQPSVVTTSPQGSTSGHSPTMWERFTSAMHSFANDVWNFLAPFGWLLLALLGLALLVLLGYLLYRFFRWLLDRFNRPSPPPVPLADSPKTPPSGHNAALDQYRTPEGPAAEQIIVRSTPDAAPPPPPIPQAPPDTKGGASGQRSFFSYARGDGKNPHMVRWQGMDIHQFERAPDGVHTVRFTHHE